VPVVRTTRYCVACAKTKPRSEFASSHPLCDQCANRRQPGTEKLNRQIEAAPDPAVPRHLREQLASLRESGLTFEDAWTIALGHVLEDLSRDARAGWFAALQETRDVWRDAFENVGPRLQVHQLHELLDHPDDNTAVLIA